jgi:hypothetical protein
MRGGAVANQRRDVFRFRIELPDIRPPIWREILVPASYSFWDLHVAIQDAMGWEDYHLHEFEVAEPESGELLRVGIPGLSGDSAPISFGGLSGDSAPISSGTDCRAAAHDAGTPEGTPVNLPIAHLLSIPAGHQIMPLGRAAEK